MLVIGDVIDDILVSISMPLRHNTDTPASISRSSGGSAANTAVWLAHLGVSVDFVGRVGHGDQSRFADEFERAGVRPHLESDALSPTGTIVIIVEAESRTMLTDRGANTQLDTEAIDQALVEGAPWVHLTGYSMFHHVDPDSISRFISAARSRGAQVMMDASSSGFLEDFGIERFLGAIAEVSLLRCNEEEALVLTRTQSIAEAIAALSQRFETVVVTQGSAGVWVSQNGESQVVPVTDPVASVDPTGAGDSFNAGLLAGLIQHETLEQAIGRGIAAASTCIRKTGARP